MKLKEQVVIEGSVWIPQDTATLVGYKHKGKLIAQAKVLGNFYCYQTNITSLQGGPSWVGGDFSCYQTDIPSLEGGPNYVGGKLYCWGTRIPSLHNIHKQIKHIGGQLYLSNKVKSHILGVVFIKGLLEIRIHGGNIEQDQVENIINKHLAGDRNVHDAQEELLEARLEEYAKL